MNKEHQPEADCHSLAGCDEPFDEQSVLEELKTLEYFDITRILGEKGLGKKWLLPSEQVFRMTRQGRSVGLKEMERFMEVINRAVRKCNPRMRRDVTIPEYLKAKEVWVEMGIFPKVLGDPGYDPKEARKVYLRELKRQSGSL